MKKVNKNNQKTANKKTISYSQGLELVKSIQKKLEGINKTSSNSTNDYSF